MYKSKQFNGFAKNELDDHLFNDIWDHHIFNESDLHSAAYHYIRKYYEKRFDKIQSDNNIYVRCEPRLNGKKPDIVVYQSAKPIYVFELKMFIEADRVDLSKYHEDLNKLRNLMQKIETLKWGFFIVVYDSDEDFNISDGILKRMKINNVSVIGINTRRTEKNGRLRRGYDAWRKEFDRLREQHKKHG